MDNFLEQPEVIAELDRAGLAALLLRIKACEGAVLARLVGGDGSKGHEAAGDLQLLGAGDVAKLCKIPVARVYELARRKQIGSVCDGRTVRFTRAQVEAFIASRSEAAAPPAGASRRSM